MADLPHETPEDLKRARRKWVLVEIIALAFVAFMGALHPWANYRPRAPGLAGSSMLPMGATMALFTVCGINALLKRKGKAPWFTAGEALAFFIVLAGGWAACRGLVPPPLPLMTANTVHSSRGS